MRRMITTAVGLWLTLAGTGLAQPATGSPVVVELYTSQGCSSCPPADELLEQIAGRADVIALALHVDYWDYIGWRDRFADPKFSARQREGVMRGGGRVVYTPQVVLSGRDHRHWRNASAFEQSLRETTARPARASLVLSAAALGKGAWRVRLEVRVAPRQGRADAYLAVYENGLESEVRAGENAGVRLRHDYVVREWIGPVAIGADGRMTLSRKIFRPDIVFAKAGVAAFVEDPDSGEILQALGLPLCTG